MSMLEVKDLQVYYGVIQALKGISFEVEQGDVVALIGANGAGKTTTALGILNLIPKAISHLRERILPMYRAISWYQWESPTCRRGAVCSLP